MLVRRFVNASFRLLMQVEWDQSACDEYNNILSDTGGPLWYVLFLITVYHPDLQIQPIRYSCPW